MTVSTKAIYQKGQLRPLEPLELPENSVVRLALETEPDDTGHAEWMSQSQRTLMSVWDNEADDVYNDLLTQ